jgi:hypothetical protein
MGSFDYMEHARRHSMFYWRGLYIIKGSCGVMGRYRTGYPKRYERVHGLITLGINLGINLYSYSKNYETVTRQKGK